GGAGGARREHASLRCGGGRESRCDRRSGAGRCVSRPSRPARAARSRGRGAPADREPGAGSPGRRSAGLVSRAGAAPRAAGGRERHRVTPDACPGRERGTEPSFRPGLVVFLLLAGCSAYAPLTDAPPSADHPWKGPGLERASAALAAPDHAREPEPVPIDAQKAYELSELIDIAERTNPETRVA